MSLSGPRPGCEPQPAHDGIAPLRVAVVGARRVRHGTGPFLARQAAGAGAEVVAVLGTRPASALEAAEELKAAGIEARACTDARELFEEVQPEAVLIASPLGTHRSWLQAAHQAGVHVYCEKPLLNAPAVAAIELARGFAASALVLAENCQWPQVLPAFRQLHPDVDLLQVEDFRMLLAPPMRGLSRWQETLSHPLSLLQVIAPGPVELEDIRYLESTPDAADSRLCFRWRTLDRAIDCEVVLEDLGGYPRPAEFAVDDALCRRRVRAEDYAISWVADHRDDAPAVSIGDPMELQLREFLVRVGAARESGSAPLDEDLIRRQAMLELLLEAYRKHVRT